MKGSEGGREGGRKGVKERGRRKGGREGERKRESLDSTVLKILCIGYEHTVHNCIFSCDAQVIATGVASTTVKVQLTLLE